MNREPTSYPDSSPLLGNIPALRERAERDGFLYFRNFLPREEILALRVLMLAVVERHGWREPGQDCHGARINLAAINKVPENEMRLDIGVSVAAYHDAQRIEMLHKLPHHPRLLGFYRDFFGEDAFVHPRHIARMVTGHQAMIPTPPHQDFPLIQGTTNTWTCWFPIGDCPREHGGLSILRGSHKNGVIPVRETRGAGGIAAQLCPAENDWVEGDFSAGDILTFPSHTVHKALRCQDKELIRLSLDIRFQSVNEPIEERSLLPHCDLSWDEIYSGWENEELQYYWRKYPLGIAPWDDSHLQPKRRIC